MGDHATVNNPEETAFADKGKGKAQEPTQDQNMESDSESGSEAELVSLRIPPTYPICQSSETDLTPSLARQWYAPRLDLVCRHT